MRDIPASSIQRRYAALFRDKPDLRHNNMTMVFEIEGAVDIPALDAALDRVVRRHDLLSAKFVERAAGLMLENVDVPLHPIAREQRTAAPDKITDEVARCALAADREVIDIEEPPLFRLRLLEVNGTRLYLLFTVHHIIADAFSTWIFVRDLVFLYREVIGGIPANGADLSGRYLKWVETEAATLAETESPRLAWWAERLDGYQPRPGRPVAAERGAVRVVGQRLERSLTAELIKAARRSAGVNASAVIHCAYADALLDCGVDHEPLIKKVVPGRSSLTEGLFGNFLNLIPVWTRRRDGDFVARARALQRDLESDAAHAFPFWSLTEALYPDSYLQPYGMSGIEHNVYQSYPDIWVDAAGLRLRFIIDAVPVPAWPQFEWCLNVRPPVSGEWELTLAYNAGTASAELAGDVLGRTHEAICSFIHRGSA